VITRATSELVEASTDRTQTRYLGFTNATAVVVNSFLCDRGDGYRPIAPLILRLDGVVAELPVEVAAGSHLIELQGEPFDGVGLGIVGSWLLGISSVTIGQSDELVAERATVTPPVLKGHGSPIGTLPLTGILGARYIDLDSGFWYLEGPTTWQQQP